MNEQKTISYTIPQMESIDKTAAAFGLSAYAVRKLARSRQGAAFTVKLGAKYFINQAKFAAFLNCETAEQDDDPAPAASGIQPVPVRM